MSFEEPHQLAVVAEEYDRDRADASAPGGSRYGAYLVDRAHQLDEDLLEDAVSFTQWCWRVATSPVMAPGYVRLRADLISITVERAESSGAPVLEVNVPLRHSQLARRVPYEIRDWERDRSSGYQALYPPADDTHPAVLVSAQLRLPLGPLYQPTTAVTASAEVLVAEAKTAIGLFVAQINTSAGPMVAGLLGDEGGAW